MNRDLTGLHHVGHVVSDIEAGVLLYQRLGFLPTQPSFYVLEAPGKKSLTVGPVNAYSSMPENFLEIVSVAKPGATPVRAEASVINVPEEQHAAFATRLAQAGDMITSWYSRYDGVHILALRSTDVAETEKRLDRTSVSHSGASSIDRKVRTADGLRVVSTAFVEIAAPEGGTILPEGRIVIAENLEDDTLPAQEAAAHPNGALALEEAFLYVDDTERDTLMQRYSKYLDVAPRIMEGGARFTIGKGLITVLNGGGLAALIGSAPAVASPMFVGYAVSVADLGVARSLLSKNGFTVGQTPSNDLVITAPEALGATVLFRQAG